jgi:hypothetical protein
MNNTSWRTSSHSNAEGNCIEVGWHTACLTDVNCVEVRTSPAAVGVRDTKDRARAMLSFNGPAWTTFLNGLSHV